MQQMASDNTPQESVCSSLGNILFCEPLHFSSVERPQTGLLPSSTSEARIKEETQTPAQGIISSVLILHCCVSK